MKTKILLLLTLLVFAALLIPFAHATVTTEVEIITVCGKGSYIQDSDVGITTPESGVYNIPTGMKFYLTATPYHGWNFKYWDINGEFIYIRDWVLRAEGEYMNIRAVFEHDYVNTPIYIPPPPTPEPTPEDKTVVLFFDDGWSSVLYTAKPILNQYGYSATVGVITSQIGWDTGTEWAKLNPDEIRALNFGGFEIASHSTTHPFLSTLTTPEIQTELTQSKQTLEEILGTSINTFIVPNSDDTPQIDTQITSTYQYFRSYTCYGHNVIFAASEPLIDFQQEILAQGNTVFLTYHQLRNACGDWITTPALFAQEMAWLHQEGYRVESLSQYMNP
jgi:hypothetical protein